MTPSWCKRVALVAVLAAGACGDRRTDRPGADAGAPDGAAGDGAVATAGEAGADAGAASCRANPGALSGGKAPGRFSTPFNVALGLHVLDYNGDGAIDLVGAGGGGEGAVTWGMRNRGNSFLIADQLAPGRLLMAPTDLDGDGDRDLLIDDGTEAPQTMRVWLSDGQGRFAAAGATLPYETSMNVGPGVRVERPVRVGAGDLNGDGLPEIAVAAHSFGGVRRWNFQVYINQAGARFAPGPRLDGTGEPEDSAGSLAVIDLDGDRRAELLLTGSSGLQVVRAVGDDRLELGPLQPSGGLVGALLAAVDADGDGDRDLFTEGAVLLNQGGTVFARSDRGLPAEVDPAFLAKAAGDIDGDGDLDLVARAAGELPSLALLRNQGGARFQRESLAIAAGYELEAVALADLDGDRRAEILAIGVDEGPPPSPGGGTTLALLWNQGAEVFPFGGLVTGSGPEYTVAADLDGDGDKDLVTANTNGTVTVLGNDGRGGFRAVGNPRFFDPFAAHSEGLAVSDLNGDGHLDLAVADQNRELWVLLGRGDLDFQNGPPAMGAQDGRGPESVAATDLDGDGDVDVVTADGTGTNVLSLFVNDGAAGLKRTSTLVVGGEPSTVLALDVDRDGRVDLVSANEKDNTVSVLRGTGPLAFAPPEHHPVGRLPDALAAGDLDGDGFQDLVTANAGFDEAAGISEDTLTILRNDGRGGFHSRLDVKVGRMPRGLSIGDLDGDGDADLVTANSLSNDATVVLNENGNFVARATVHSGPGPQGVVLADLDGRCGLDFAIANKRANEVRVVQVPPAP
jgi:hypothetical protein